MLELLKEMLPKQNMLPNCNYEAKNILCSVALEYKMIHECPNNCVLYKDEFVALKVCLTCGLSWLKNKVNESSSEEEAKDPLAMLLWYLPIIPRLK